MGGDDELVVVGVRDVEVVDQHDVGVLKERTCPGKIPAQVEIQFHSLHSSLIKALSLSSG